MKTLVRSLTLVAGLAILLPGALLSQNGSFPDVPLVNPSVERILSFNTDIKVDTTTRLTVTERITVNATGTDIQRGIFRKIPRSRNINGGWIYVKNRFLSVRKDGQPEPFHETSEGDFDVIYIGDEDIYLTPGRYEYEIIYETEKQIGFFDGYDELYWNVTGNEWTFPIDQVSAVVHLPQNVEIIQHACYTGVTGSTEKNCTSDQIAKNLIEWKASGLSYNEGLTIAVGFTPGVIKQAKPPAFLDNDGVSRLLAIVTVLLLAAMVYLWRKFGIDHEKPTVIPLFEPPGGLSPAAAGYVDKGYSKNKMIAASLINLAVNGYIRIIENPKEGLFGKKTFTLRKLNNELSGLPPEEKDLMTQLFHGSKLSVNLTGSYDSSVASAVTRFMSTAQKEYGKFHKKGSNSGKVWLLFGILTLVYGIMLYVSHHYLYDPGKWVGGIVIYVIVFILFASFTTVRTASTASWIWVIPVAICALGAYLYIKFINPAANPFSLAYLFLIVNTNLLIIFSYLIRQPSPDLIQRQVELEGFNMYLKAAENQLMQFHNPPKMTPRIFEKYLPYALILGTDKIWGEKFESYLNQNAMQYNTSWYSGGSTRHFSGGIASSLGSSLASSVSSSSTSSGSGSGGGGSSGGGGGGGGGGGW